ncbi:MAG: hypothetical protein H0X62_13440 [Bacteroidetes bacterium]|jgi:hypothetical protein|nr:hypothetical protein [Bacteroidota bacterium]
MGKLITKSIDFAAINLQSIPEGGHIIGLDAANGNKLSRIDKEGNINMIEGATVNKVKLEIGANEIVKLSENYYGILALEEVVGKIIEIKGFPIITFNNEPFNGVKVESFSLYHAWGGLNYYCEISNYHYHSSNFLEENQADFVLAMPPFTDSFQTRTNILYRGGVDGDVIEGVEYKAGSLYIYSEVLPTGLPFNDAAKMWLEFEYEIKG